ncbi:MAG: hypothetical protein NC411_08435 [Bacteroides sp.]|nr:hypothetical protein [Bacteroides sp.]
MHNISNLSDKFSWRRAAGIALVYKKPIKIYLLIAACTTLLCYMLSRLIVDIGGDSIRVVATVSIITSFTLYLSPLTFSRDDRTLIGLLPAKPIEKWAFYTVYCIILVPIIVDGIWYGLDYIYSIIFSTPRLNTLLLARYNLTDISIGLDESILIVGSIFQVASLVAAVLYAVLSYRKHRIVAGLLAMFIYIFAIGFLSGIGGAVMAINCISDSSSSAIDPQQIVDGMLPVFKIIYGFITILGIYMLWLCYRRIAKGDIKA